MSAFQRRRGRPANVVTVDGVSTVRVGGFNFRFSVGANNRLNPRGETRDEKGSENFVYAQQLVRESLLSPVSP